MENFRAVLGNVVDINEMEAVLNTVLNLENPIKDVGSKIQR